MTQRPVALPDMLEAREQRYWAQQRLLERFQLPLICFTMNIAGPIKNNDAILRGFRLGQRLLSEQLTCAGISVHFQAEITEFTGNEAFYALDVDPFTLKRLTCEIEDNAPVGRLFDMDVLDASGAQVSRKTLNLPGRKCLICGGPAKECSSRRVHSVEELQVKTAEILQKTLQKEDRDYIGELAARSLLYEVGTTPKPGLVDRRNNGSHADMDIFTFFASTAALQPYFAQCAQIGMDTAESDAPETFRRIRWSGKQAEAAMNRATNGVNTHKGAIFSLGILCAALGRLGRERWTDSKAVLSECAAMVQGIVQREFAGITAENARTAGQKLYLQHGITGVRGQAEAGFPAVLTAGLPTLERALSEGYSINDAGCCALLALMCAATDTNLISRSDHGTQLSVVEQVETLLKKTPFPDEDTLAAMDAAFISRNLSPGGSADLLSMTYFLHFLKENQ